jgi:phospholipid transport system substrate-binding protein
MARAADMEFDMRMLPFAAAAAVMLSAGPALAQASDPAVATVQMLDNGLIATMKAGKAAGVSGRTARIGPVIDRAFDIPLMTRLAVGPQWTSISPADQQALVAAFRRMTVSEYAKNFDDYSGQSFVVAPNVEARGGDKLVRTTLKDPQGSDVAIAYRLRQDGGQWQIIDVFYKNSISQIATRRSDFAGVLQKGGAKALIAHLNALSAKAGG